MSDEKASKTEQLRAVLQSVCGTLMRDISVEHGDVNVRVDAVNIFEVLKRCKESPALDFAMLIDITAVDWMDSRERRFEVVYQLLSLSRGHRVTLSVSLSEDDPRIASCVDLWKGANFLEREVWDMFGITFTGHPDLRRVLMYDEFVGHPLRKDYPVQGKQPRIPLRSAEVENTARRMLRGDLVTIKSRGAGSRDSSVGQGE